VDLVLTGFHADNHVVLVIIADWLHTEINGLVFEF